MTHTPECLNYQKTLEEDRAAWQAKYPDHCRKCEGAGGHEVPATRDTPPDYDVCICVDAGKCPRCGTDLDLVDQDGELLDGDCGGCGWTGRGADDICPPPFDGCGCTGDEEEVPPDLLYVRDGMQTLTSKEYHDLAIGSFPPPEDDPPQGDGYPINGLIDDGRRPPF